MASPTLGTELPLAAVPLHDLLHSPPLPRTHRPLALLTLGILLTAQALPAKSATPNTYIGPDQGLWSNPANWTAGIPNSAGFDVFLTDPTGLSSLLDTPETINDLTITLPNTLTLQPGIALSLAGTSLSNTGSILINATASLFFTASTALSGGGNIQLLGASAAITGASTAFLTTDNRITGQGNISGVMLANTGTISAASGTLTISLSNTVGGFTNSGLLSASGGLLSLSNDVVENAGGVIQAGNAGGILISKSQIMGGSLLADNGGTISISNSLLNVGMIAGNVYVSGPITITSSSLVNTGVLNLTSMGSIVFYNGLNLSGGGTLNLASAQAPVLDGFEPGTSALLTNDNTIVGFGQVDAGFSNTGTITAFGGKLSLNGTPAASQPNLNQGLLCADGATLACTYAVNNTGGIIEAVNPGGLVLLGSVTGGLIRGVDGGVYQLSNGSYVGVILCGAGTVTASIRLSGSCSLSGSLGFANSTGIYASGTLNNNGLIQLGQGAVGIPDSLDVTGDGTITMAGGQFYLPGPSGTLTNESTIAGGGIFGVDGINKGSITATAGQQMSIPDFQSNSGLFLADNGSLGVNPLDTGTSSFLDNTGGLIEARGTQSTVTVSGHIRGGTIDSLAGGEVDFYDAALENVTFAGTGFFEVAPMDLIGSLNNSGTLTFATGYPVAIEGDFALSGEGTSNIRGSTSNPTITSDSAYPNSRLTTSNMIVAYGLFSGIKITNTGTISATSGTLVMTPPIDPTGFISTGSLVANGGTLQFNQSTFLISGTLQAINGGTLDFESGSVSIACPTLVNGSALFNASAQYASSITGLGSVSIGPSGCLTSDAITVSTLTISGAATIRNNLLANSSAGTSVVNALLIATDSANHFTGSLDLTDNALILESTNTADKATKIAFLQSAIQSGFNGTAGTWTGTGITSSTLAADAAAGTNNSFHTTLAIVDNGAYPPNTGFTVFAGEPVDANSIILVRALVGDANLDGTVNNTDLVALLTHFGETGQTQATGDYNGDGSVNNTDLVALLTDYGQTLPGGEGLVPSTDGASALGGSPEPVPEPGSLLLIAGAAVWMLRPRRRNGGDAARGHAAGKPAG